MNLNQLNEILVKELHTDPVCTLPPFSAVRAELEKAVITPDKNISAHYGTSREGSLLQSYLKHVAG